MGFMDFVPLAAPAVAIIGSAVWITLREVRIRRVVIDLTHDEVPEVRLAGMPVQTKPVTPRSGNLVSAPGATLGARLQHTQSVDAGGESSPRRRARVRRRTSPLVADRS